MRGKIPRRETTAGQIFFRHTERSTGVREYSDNLSDSGLESRGFASEDPLSSMSVETEKRGEISDEASVGLGFICRMLRIASSFVTQTIGVSVSIGLVRTLDS